MSYGRKTGGRKEREPGLNNELLHLVAMLDACGDPRDTRKLKQQAIDIDRDRLRALVDLQGQFGLKTPEEAREAAARARSLFPEQARDWDDEVDRKRRKLRAIHPNWAGWRDKDWWKVHLPIEDEPAFAVKSKKTLDDCAW